MLYKGETETCQRCDGTSVVVDERRDRTRPGGEIAAEFTMLRNLMALEIAVRDSQIDGLIAENRRFREAIEKAARIIERRSHAKPQPHA